MPRHRVQRRESSSCSRGRRWPRTSTARRRDPMPRLRLLVVATELLAHRGQHPVREVGLAARLEPVEQRGDSTWTGTPSSIAASAVQRPSPESDTRPSNSASVGRLRERVRGEVEQPRRDHAPPAPHLGDRGRGRGRTGSTAGPAAAWSRRRASRRLRCRRSACCEHVQALGVRRHHPVLDPVVDHLHEVAGAGRPAVEVALLRGRRVAGPPGGARARRRRRARSSRGSGRGGSRRRPRRRSSGRTRARARRRRRSSRCPRSGRPISASFAARSTSSR